MDLSTALSALAFAGTAMRNAIELRDQLKLADTERALNQRIIETQIASVELLEKMSAATQANSSLKDQIRQLEGQVADLREKARRREEVTLITLPTGATMYRLNGSPLVNLCQPCMDNREKRSVLQPETSYYAHYFCPECKTKFQVAETGPGIA